MSVNTKYNEVVYGASLKKEGDIIKAKSFGLDFIEYKTIIEEIERNGLFKSGDWLIERGSYMFGGLTVDGQNFVENNDKKEYHKIKKTENYHHTTISIGDNNNGHVITGDNNVVGNNEFEEKFSELIKVINNSELRDKNIFIKELNIHKNNQEALKQYMTKNLLSKVVEVSTVVSAISGLLGLI